MSVITNIILSVSVLDTHSVDTSISDWLKEQHRSPLLRVDDYWQDRKVLEIPVYIGAYNYLNIFSLYELIAYGVDWKSPLDVMFVDKTEDSNLHVFTFVINDGFVCPCGDKIDRNKTRQECGCGRAYWITPLWNDGCTILRFEGL